MRVGIMGGSFDPIHNGHLFLAENARVTLQLDKTLFIPTGNPPHKDGSRLAPAYHRYAMTLIGTHFNRYFECSRIEVERPGVTYAIDTLRQLKKQMPNAELFYITGLDAVAELTTWRHHQEVMQLAHFAVATRPGFDIHLLKERLPASYLERIFMLPPVWLNISSTDIRERVRKGAPIRYLTPDGVTDYIYKRRLYHSEANPEGSGAIERL